ncbi:MAG: hypothetical protein K2N73_09730 [Lachnospiraceae bacterium]|nr:hypothetical protein [Lachnospiraceae bacterium]
MDKEKKVEMEMETWMQQGIDSKAVFATYLTRLPVLILLAVAGAVLGSGLHLLIALAAARDPVYVSETEYYISFAEGRYADYYNDFTWNDVIGMDTILGRAMELLGTGYDKNQVKSMITADILSDVRFLTITVRGQEPEAVEAVKNAIGTALEEYGNFEDAFSAIDKVDDLEIIQEKIHYFGWRAAFLGAVVFAGIGIFAIALRVSIGSVFYTKCDVMKILGVPICGLTFAGNNRKKADDIFITRQQRMLSENLKMLSEKYDNLMLMDASDGKEAEAFLQDIRECGLTESVELGMLNTDCAGEHIHGTAIIAVIPFGKSYREKIADEINYARLQGGEIVAAVLIKADRIWSKIYYGWK